MHESEINSQNNSSDQHKQITNPSNWRHIMRSIKLKVDVNREEIDTPVPLWQNRLNSSRTHLHDNTHVHIRQRADTPHNSEFTELHEVLPEDGLGYHTWAFGASGLSYTPKPVASVKASSWSAYLDGHLYSGVRSPQLGGGGHYLHLIPPLEQKNGLHSERVWRVRTARTKSAREREVTTALWKNGMRRRRWITWAINHMHS